MHRHLAFFYKYLSKTYFDLHCKCTGRILIFIKYISVISSWLVNVCMSSAKINSPNEQFVLCGCSKYLVRNTYI